jgi:hypothetical protein
VLSVIKTHCPVPIPRAPPVPTAPSASSGPPASSASSSDGEEAILINVEKISDSEPSEHSDEENVIPQLLDENIRPFLSSGFGTPQQSITEVINYFPISGHASAYGKKTTRYEYFYPNLPAWRPFCFNPFYY